MIFKLFRKGGVHTMMKVISTNKAPQAIGPYSQAIRVDGFLFLSGQIFIKDMNDFPVINEEYSQFMQGHNPARSTVEVSRLPKDVRIEIEPIAKKYLLC